MVADGLPVLSTLERRAVAVVIALAVALLAGVVVVLLRWADIKAWLDAPEMLRVNEAALEVPLPGNAEDDPTRSASAQFGALRSGWTELAPRDALEQLAEALRDVDVDPVLCDDPALPRGPRDHELECGLRVPVHDEELWVFAIDHTPSGEVPLGRTAMWFAWDTYDMAWPIYERLVAADPVPYPFEESDGPPLTTPEQVDAALPARYAGVTDQCWGPDPTGEVPCTMWEGPVDTADLPDDGQGRAQALVRELVAAGFFVDAADPSWSSEPLSAHRFLTAGGWTGLKVDVRPEGGGLVAGVMAV